MSTTPIRVGLVIGQLSYGGAESQAYELARGLAARHGVVVYCLSSSFEPYGARLARAGIEVRKLVARGPLDVSRVMRLASSLRRDRIEIAHAFLFIASAYTYLATRLAPGVAFVASARNCKVEPSVLRRVVMRRAFRAADAAICNSREVAAFAARHYGARKERIHVVYNGVDAARFAGTLRAHEGLRIGTIGRLEAQKNLGMFLRAAREVAAAHPTATFEIAGAGSLLEAVRAEARELGLAERVRFVGPIADVPSFMAGLDQFWLTSDWEGTPNVVMEAMAAGLPVIATAVGGTPEILDAEHTGILVAAGDVAALVAAASRLVQDRRAAHEMGDRAREAARSRFSIAAMVQATEEVYQAAMGARRGLS
jgi:glycosyltransferase involved in cell wall biosynthesis